MDDGVADRTGNSLMDDYRALVNGGKCGWDALRPFQRRLGGGGQGIVYLSERIGVENFSIPVALKIFSPERFSDSRKYESEMSRQAQVASRVARIQHDHLVDVQIVVRHGGVYIMEMEWVDGYDIRRLLTPHAYQQVRENVTERRWKNINEVIVTKGPDQPRLRPGTAVAIIRECLMALSALHRNGVVHNDIKPGNIMLKRSGNAKIIDIGSAFEIENPPEGISCTPGYAAPEVLQGNPATPRSDLASLGYMLIEMLAGEQPFEGMAYAELLQAKQNIHDWLPGKLPTEEFAFSEALIRLIRGLVDPDPSKRFESADEADLSHNGAAEFQRELVKGDLSSEYESEIRHWIEEVEEEFHFDESEFIQNSDTTMPSTKIFE